MSIAPDNLPQSAPRANKPPLPPQTPDVRKKKNPLLEQVSIRKFEPDQAAIRMALKLE